ncbi:hypothetical protein ACWGHA_10975 [Streptomyces xanthophaeus]
MSHIMPDRVADLIPSARPKPEAPTPSPFRVAMFSAAKRPARQVEAAVRLTNIERDLLRLRPLASIEDQGDRETLLAQHAAADKILAGSALRQSTAVLS